MALPLVKKEDSFLGKRFEFKYILDQKTAILIQNFAEKIGLQSDHFSRDDFYTVNSLYFDTPDLNDYIDKDGSFLHRKKMRSRIYEKNWNGNIDKVWMEIKRKHNMNISKERAEIDGETFRKFMSGNSLALLDYNGSEGDKKALNSFTYHYLRQGYRPHIIVKYERKAFLDKFTSSVRMTFDKNVRACLVSKNDKREHMVSVSGNKVILEIKFNNILPAWFSKMITDFDLQRDDFSKYRNSVAVLRGLNRVEISR